MRAAPRILTVLAAVVAPLALGACATGRALPTYQQEYDALNAQCVERGGILSPSGLTSGRAQTDYVCKISGGAARIP